MSTQFSTPATSTNRAGLCPHGLPPAACPICSGGAMAGGGKLRDTTATKPMNSGQWSWMKCYAAGLAIKAQEQRVENAKNSFERQIEFAKQLGKSIQNLAERIKDSVENIQKIMPKLISEPIKFIANVIIMPIINMIAKIPVLIEKFALLQQNITSMILQAGEKLTALLGEIKSFIDKKITENIKVRAKKFFLFFLSDIEDENYKNDDTLAVFKARELRKYIVKILKPIRKRKDDANRGIESKTI